MERTAIPGAVARTSRWVAHLEEAHAETPTARTLRFHVADWPGHLPGQHVDLRLTAEDGYVAQRSYSLSAPADGARIEVTVQLVPDGEVSPYLVEDIREGDALEVVGPVGGWFVWRAGATGPVLLIGGGSGVAPLWAIWQARAEAGLSGSTRLLYSVRTPRDVLFAQRLLGAEGVETLYTRQAPPTSSRTPHRISAEDLRAHGVPAEAQPTCYVCGPTPFVESVIEILIAAGHDASRVRAERFGPTGG
jgi:ferredoxin-NADP reductase